MDKASQPWRQWILTPDPHIHTQNHRRLSIELQSILSKHCIYLGKIYSRHVTALFDSGISTTFRILSRALLSSTELRLPSDGMPTFLFCLSQSSFPEAVKGMESSQWVQHQALQTLTYRNSFELRCLGLPLTWIFLELNIEQKWTFQTGKECKVLRDGFQRAKLTLNDYWLDLTATWQAHMGSGAFRGSQVWKANLWIPKGGLSSTLGWNEWFS